MGEKRGEISEMSRGRSGNNRKLKLFLIAVIGLSLAGVIAIFAGYRQLTSDPGAMLSALEDRANIAIGTVRQTATKDGRTQWRLNAQSARYINAEKKAILEKPAVFFYLQDQTDISLTAQQGVLKTDSNDIRVQGEIVMKGQGYELTTETLWYAHGQRRLHTDTPVAITGKGFKLAADSMSVNLDTRQTLFKGNVRGSFGELLRF